MGFFSYEHSPQNRYFGIWYKKISSGTVIWVANRETAIANTSGVIRVTSRGIVVSSSQSTDNIIWSSNYLRSVDNPVAQLLDSGNLVFVDGNDKENFVWQSFDYPVDNFLPGMKFGYDLESGIDRYFLPYKSDDDPSPGTYIHRIDHNGYPQLILWKDSDTEAYYISDLLSSSESAITRLTLTPDGEARRLIWNREKQDWTLILTLQVTDCERYGLCGLNGVCNINTTPRCQCMEGFDPKVPEEWAAADWSNGCSHNVQLECGNGDGFMRSSGCLNDCNCTAYSNTDIRDGGSGCLLWFGDLNDIRGYSEDGQDLFVRMAASELIEVKLQVRQDLDLPLFGFTQIENATDNFSDDNKIGSGGFGTVYKGILEEGSEIAVKRLSKDSNQGVEEFMNEVACIAKLQHRNLVRLLGCCIEEGERLLIYEYLPNKSLDTFIFVSNILLDHEMNPKISDFGLARIFGEGETQGSTTRLVGTHVIFESDNQHEVFRVIQIGLLCVQEYPEDRPDMSSAFRMLTSNDALPVPKQPGFFSERRSQPETDSSSRASTLNTISVSFLSPR
ncbi:hypothetical protein DCAR_0309864 [Daucus carota subsp. sativus]|uniref:non-specific serine/threonine protein kinase n=1 Tax=Daucus carota subsp. sativus TaxID=79200 RepID=A0AAF0WIP0_DAUCS|nr:hypothetical protein DCAR_0309864 [Daucus carota subsp. sativus]